MKKRIFSYLFFTFSIFILFNTTHAQTLVGPIIGIQTNASELSNKNTPQELAGLNLDGKLGYRAGLFARIPIGSLYIQPELLLTTHRSTYSFRDIQAPSGIKFRDENGINFEIPTLIGLKFDALRVQAGPVASFTFIQNSDFEEEEGWTRDFKRNNWGFQLGVGVDFWRFILDLNYQVPLNQGTEGINIGGQTYELNKNDGILVLTLGLNLRKN